MSRNQNRCSDNGFSSFKGFSPPKTQDGSDSPSSNRSSSYPASNSPMLLDLSVFAETIPFAQHKQQQQQQPDGAFSQQRALPSLNAWVPPAKAPMASPPRMPPHQRNNDPVAAQSSPPLLPSTVGRPGKEVSPGRAILDELRVCRSSDDPGRTGGDSGMAAAQNHSFGLLLGTEATEAGSVKAQPAQLDRDQLISSLPCLPQLVAGPTPLLGQSPQGISAPVGGRTSPELWIRAKGLACSPPPLAAQIKSVAPAAAAKAVKSAGSNSPMADAHSCLSLGPLPAVGPVGRHFEFQSVGGISLKAWIS